MGNVMSKFLMPLNKVFPLPKSAAGQEDQFFEAYFAVLKTFDNITLSAGADHMIATRTQRTFPLPAECNLACAEAVKGEAIRGRQESQTGNRHEHLPFHQRYPEWSEHRIEAANALIASDTGREALKEKWIVALHDFCRVNLRLPDRHEIVEVRKKGISVQKDFEALVDKNPLNPLVKNLINLRRAMFDRLGKAVNGELHG